MHISFLDIAIMVLYLVFTLFIGYYVSKKVNGFEDFALGGRSFGPFALAATFGATASSVCFAAMMSLTAYASGDVAGAVTSTWGAAKSQVVSVVNNVVFPVIDVILAVLLFVKITLAYLDYRKHGQLEWTPIAIIFGCLIFSLTCPLYIWSII